MQIDIVMPFYRGIHFLKDALVSLAKSEFKTSAEGLLEDLRPVVLLVMDNSDGKEVKSFPGHKSYSDEEFRKIVEELIYDLRQQYPEMPYVKPVFTKGEQTVASLRNIGINMSEGEYIYFFDSDDYVCPDTIKKLAMKAVRVNADIVFGDIKTTYYKYSEACEENISSPHDLRKDSLNLRDNSFIRKRLVQHDFSVLNALIKREFIHRKDNEVFFDENVKLYPDVGFMLKLFSQNACIITDSSSVYMKRIHNDAIMFPALSQLKVSARGNERQVEYDKALAWAADNKTVYEDNTEVNPGHENLCRVISLKDDVATAVRDIYRQEKTAYRKKCITRIGNFFKHPTFLYRMIEKFIFSKLPVKKNWVLFESFLGKNYSDSCKYIYEYLLCNKGDAYRYIWVVNDKNTSIPGNVTKVKYLSLRWFYYSSRCGYYVNNMRQPVWYRKRKETVFLETWHGTPLKKLVFDMDDIHAATQSYKMDMYGQSRKWDYLISDNSFSTETFERCFLYPKEKIIETGYPRNDILYADDREERAAAVKKKLGIPLDKRVILYAPTWRDDEYYGPGQYQFALRFDLKHLKEELGDEYVILLRTHYFIADAIDTRGLEDFAYNVSRYDDIAELYIVSDICITDYSSVFFDYANLLRPILFYVYDFDKYKDTLRGFYISMENEVPGPLLYTEDEVIEAVKYIDNIVEEYSDRYTAFCKRFCNVSDGNASKRVVEQVFDGSKGEEK